MELTADQRAELDAILARRPHSYERAGRDPADRGTSAKQNRRQDRAALVALRKAWDRLRPQTQEDVIAHLIGMWEEYDHEHPMPDIGRVADLLEKAMVRPNPHAEEEHPGFGEAAEYLWTLWVARRHGVDVPESLDVPIDARARSEIGELLAPHFDLTPMEAAGRLSQTLHRRNRAKDRVRPIAGRRRWVKP